MPIQQEFAARASGDGEGDRQQRQNYECEFRKAVEREFPLGNFARASLKQFRQSLGLSDATAEQIECPILQECEAALSRQRQDEERRKLQQREWEAEQAKQQQVVNISVREGVPPQ